MGVDKRWRWRQRGQLWNWFQKLGGVLQARWGQGEKIRKDFSGAFTSSVSKAMSCQRMLTNYRFFRDEVNQL